MQYAYIATFEVGQTTPVIVQFTVVAAIQPQSQSVNGEITAMQIELDTAALDRRQGSGMLVKLGAGRNKVQEFRG